MAKDRNRGNREAKKPKTAKKTIAPATASFVKTPAAVLPSKAGRK